MTPSLVLRQDRQAWTLKSVRTVQVKSPGTLVIRGSSAWLTVDGEAKDRVLRPGEQLTLSGGHRLVVEPWVEGQSPELRWQPALPASAFMPNVRAAIHQVLAWPKVQR
jgi:hypothetical protein